MTLTGDFHTQSLVSPTSKLLPPISLVCISLFSLGLYPLSICLLKEREQQQMSEGYNPHSSLYGVCEQQTSRSIDLLILLLDVA